MQYEQYSGVPAASSSIEITEIDLVLVQVL